MTDMNKNWPVDPERLAKGLYWQEAWKLVEGCTHVSAGCDHCWSAAETRVRAGQANKKISGPKKGLIEGGRFNGKIRPREDNLDLPLKRKKPTVFSCWNDLFHEGVPDEFIDRVFAVMALSDKHTFMVLTKRPERMRSYMNNRDWSEVANGVFDQYIRRLESQLFNYGEIVPPLSNVLLGVSVEDQKTADARIPLLLQTPAAKRFVSYEPVLGPVDFTRITMKLSEASIVEGTCLGTDGRSFSPCGASGKGIDWLIMGGESGPGARPLHPAWARSVRDQCQAAGLPFFFKQWGEWASTSPVPGGDLGGDMRRGIVKIVRHDHVDDGRFRRGDALMRRVGKARAGCLLDGKEHKETPR